MKIKLLRHATVILTIGNKRILVDPMLKNSGECNPVPTCKKGKGLRNPMVELPIDKTEINEMLNSIDAILITHMHFDHFDDLDGKTLPKQIPIICQFEDVIRLKKIGFKNLYPVGSETRWEGIKIDRVKCRHGGFLLRHIMGSVSGYVFKCSGEPSLYITSDTVWCSHVKNALLKYNPEIIMLNAGAARLPIGRSITMDSSDILEVCNSAPNSKVIAVHMESINHCLLSRAELRDYLEMKQLFKVFIPEDGEVLEFL